MLPLHWDEPLTDNSALDKCSQCKNCALQSDGSVYSDHYQKSCCTMYPYPQFKPITVMLNKECCPFRQEITAPKAFVEQAFSIAEMAQYILDDRLDLAKESIDENYPFVHIKSAPRRYSEKQKFQIFLRDGFIDRYSGKKLVNPGILKCLSFYFPKEFPYHPHWKMENCHRAYWELLPTIDHIMPIARGGQDVAENWVCTSMLNNSIKSNWTLEELRWSVFPPGNHSEWDGLTSLFLKLVDKNPNLLSDPYIQRWHRVSQSDSDGSLCEGAVSEAD